MANDTIVCFSDPALRDELSDVVREDAGRVMVQSVGAELQTLYLEDHSEARHGTARHGTVGRASVGSQQLSTEAGGVDGRWGSSVLLPKTATAAVEGVVFAHSCCRRN